MFVRAKRARDVWLIMEPAFLSQHPGLEALNGKLAKPTAAILSTNEDWMLSVVKKSLPQVRSMHTYSDVASSTTLTLED